MTTTTPTGTARYVPAQRPSWLSHDAWPFPIRTLTVGDHEIAYTDVGDGPVLLFVHVGMWSFVWRDVIADLAPDFRCVTLDAPGSGLSSGRGRVELTMASAAIDELVRQLDLRDVVLVLHDLGGVATLHAAAAWPDRIRGMALVNTFGWRPSGIAFRSMLALMGSGLMREIDAFTGWLPRATATRVGVGRHWDRATRKVFRAGMRHRGRRSFHRYMRSARRFDFAPVDAALAQLRSRPAITVFGERNDFLGFQTRWATRLDDLEQLEVRKGNHFPMCDAPAVLTEAIRRRFDHAERTPEG